MPVRFLRAASAAAILLPLLAFAASDLPPQNLPVVGGTGGSGFSRDCGAGRVLSGLRYRSGLVIDALGLLCRPVLAGGELGPESTIGTLAGGTGGGTTNFVSCPAGFVVGGLYVVHGSYVSYIVAICDVWQPSTRSRTFSTSTSRSLYVGDPGTPGSNSTEKCESTFQPGAGIRGRAASFVDALGLVCDEP